MVKPCVALVLSSYMEGQKRFTIYTQMLSYYGTYKGDVTLQFHLRTGTYRELYARFQKPDVPFARYLKFWDVLDSASVYLADEKILHALSNVYPDKYVIPLAKLLPTIYNEPEPNYPKDFLDMCDSMFWLMYEYIVKLMWSSESNLFQELLLFEYLTPAKPHRTAKIQRTATVPYTVR